MTHGAAALDERILALVATGVAAPRDDTVFEQLARDLFAYQYEQNAPYRRLCDADGVAPAAVESVDQIPACPTDAFKHYELTTFPVGDAVACFHTSGTTDGRPGRHWLPTLELYEAAARASFEWYCYPDGRPGRHLVLFPEAVGAGDSSLGTMFRWMAGPPGSKGTRWQSADPDSAADAYEPLRQAEASGQPVAVLATAIALVNLFDGLEELAANPFRLPAGSRVLETGGYKGRSRSVEPEALRASASAWLGIPEEWIINEYGMTEMGSQFYDNTLRAALGLGGSGDRVKRPPPWVRSWVVDPADSRREVADGETGLLKHLDLVNRGSVCCLLTGDLARRVDDGFELLGRATGAELRGCSLRTEQLSGR